MPQREQLAYEPGPLRPTCARTLRAIPIRFLAVWVDGQADRHPQLLRCVRIRVQAEVVDVERQVRDLLRFTSIHWETPDLAALQEAECGAVRVPAEGPDATLMVKPPGFARL